MTDRQRRDYFFFVMKSWRMEMERSQQYMKAMEKSANAESGAPAGTQASAATTVADASAAEPEPEAAPSSQPAGAHTFWHMNDAERLAVEHTRP